MSTTGFLIVAFVYAAVTVAAYAIIHAFRLQNADLALIVAALTTAPLGFAIWRRQSPSSTLRQVRAGIGVVLALSAVVVSLILQKLFGWLRYPEAAIPIAAIGCFVYPFIMGKRTWEALGKSPGNSA